MGNGTQKKSGLISKLFRNLKKQIRQHCNVSSMYQYKKFSIKLPPNHLLPEYQRRHPKYDKFLPHLAKYATSTDTIVDIGANVGDTLAGMVEQNQASNYICIEPDAFFYMYLEENIERIRKSITDLKVTSIQALVGWNVSNVSLNGEGGTKHAVIDSNGGIESTPLDDIILNELNVRILKIDVDGFDYDVLESSLGVIDIHKPILFFECQYAFEYQKSGYLKILRKLQLAGYCDWTVFDNFGELIVRTNDLNIISQLMTYIWQQNIGKSTRTIYYVDILSVQKADSLLVNKVLSEYGNLPG